MSRTSGLRRSEGPRKTEIGTVVAHVTRDLDTTFKVKGQLAGAEHIVAASHTLVLVVVNQPSHEAVLVCYRHASMRFLALPQG